MTQIETIIAEIERLKAEIPYHENAWSVLNKLKEFINSLPAEQPSEELEEKIEGKINEYWNEWFSHGDYFEGTLPKNVFAAYCHKIAQWQKHQTIKKACEWLNKNVVEYHPRKGELRPIVNINAFREAMGKEDEPNRVNIEPPSFEESQGEFNSYNVALNG